ncbi:MAG: cytochrome C, partial [Nitrospirae bacterium]|nr:cytochrome C [Nitrospirota bacterium]
LDGSQKTGVFKWYDRSTGEIVASPVMKGSPGSFKAKIIPFEKTSGAIQRVDSEDKINFALEYKQNEKTLSEAQKSKAKKLIHKIVSKQPYICEDCHQKERPLLPLDDIGYPRERIDSITSTEVVGMIKNYTKFYMPKMLQPGEIAPKQ